MLPPRGRHEAAKEQQCKQRSRCRNGNSLQLETLDEIARSRVKNTGVRNRPNVVYAEHSGKHATPIAAESRIPRQRRTPAAERP